MLLATMFGGASLILVGNYINIIRSATALNTITAFVQAPLTCLRYKFAFHICHSGAAIEFS